MGPSWGPGTCSSPPWVPSHLHGAFRTPCSGGHSWQGPVSSLDPEPGPLAGPFLGWPAQVACDGSLPVRLATDLRSSFGPSLPTRLPPRPSLPQAPGSVTGPQLLCPLGVFITCRPSGGTHPGTPSAGQPRTHTVSTPPRPHHRGPQPSATPSSEVSQASPSAQPCLPCWLETAGAGQRALPPRLPRAAVAQPGVGSRAGGQAARGPPASSLWAGQGARR